MENQQENFYEYQQRRLGILLGWGLLSSLAGLLMQLNTATFWRQFGRQALAWGAIDAALAVLGINTAFDKEARYVLGELDSSQVTKEARGFRRLLLVNAGLDVGYIVGGFLLAQRSKARSDRQGMGLGVILQGLWLLLFDSLLALDVGRRWKENQ